MKSLKSVLLSIIFLLTATFSLQATSIEPHKPNKANTLREQVVGLVQNPGLLDQGIRKAVIDIKFKINEDGEIVLQELSSQYQYLIEFVKQKLHHQKINLTPQEKMNVYYLRINFEVQ